MKSLESYTCHTGPLGEVSKTLQRSVIMESCNTESSLDLPLESLSLQPFLQSLHKEQWQEVRLGEVAEMNNGKARPKNYGDYPIYGGNGILGYGNQYNCDSETIIVGRVGAYCGCVYYEKQPIWVSDNAIIVKAKSENNIKFLYYVLKSMNLNDYALGSSHPLLTQNLLNTLQVEIPKDITTQQKIAEILSSFDDKIDLLHRQNKTLESLALTLFRHYFIDNPKRNEWEEKPLSEVCQIKNGFAFKSEEYKKIGIPVVRTTNFKNGFVENHNLVYLDENDKNKYSKYLLQVNDFLLVMVGASLGKYAIVTSEILPALQNQNMWNFRVLGSVSQYYLNYAMQEIIANNINTASGSAREFFQKSYFYKIPILIPPKNIMMKFHTQMDNFYHKTTNNRKQIQNLQAMRDMLLKAIFA